MVSNLFDKSPLGSLSMSSSRRGGTDYAHAVLRRVCDLAMVLPPPLQAPPGKGGKGEKIIMGFGPRPRQSLPAHSYFFSLCRFGREGHSHRLDSTHSIIS